MEENKRMVGDWEEFRKAWSYNRSVDDKQRRDLHVDGPLANLYEGTDVDRRNSIIQAAATVWPRITEQYSKDSMKHPRVIQEAVDLAEMFYLEVRRRERMEWPEVPDPQRER